MMGVRILDRLKEIVRLPMNRILGGAGREGVGKDQ